MTTRSGFIALVTTLVVGAYAEVAGRVSGGSQQLLWPGGVLAISYVDVSLESVASAVLDELERKTFLRVVREDQQGGLAIRASLKAPPLNAETKWTELCCFDPASGSATVRRRLALALLRAVGIEEPDSRKVLVINPAARTKNIPVSVVRSSVAIDSVSSVEADAVNALYASAVLPRPGSFPARVDIGIYQLVSGEDQHESVDWSEMVEGRGRRVMAGAMLLAKNLVAGGLSTSLVGMLPTFIFRGNKAEVVLLGPETAEFVAGSAMPPEAHTVDALGASIRVATLHARGLASRHFAGGVPTYLGDGSALLLRSARAKAVRVRDFGETSEAILREHRSAIAWSRASRWAQGRGALLGFPSFVDTGDGLDLEVLLLHGAGFVDRAFAGGSMLTSLADGQDGATPPAGWSLGGALAVFWGTILTVLPLGYVLLYSRRCSGVHHLSRAERDLERLVASL